MRNCSGLWNQLTFFQSRGKPIPTNSQILCSLGTKIKCLFWNKHTTKPEEKQFMKRLWYETFKYIYVNKNPFGSHGLGFFVQAFAWNFFTSFTVHSKVTHFLPYKIILWVYFKMYCLWTFPFLHPLALPKSLVSKTLRNPYWHFLLLLSHSQNNTVAGGTARCQHLKQKNLCQIWKHGVNAEGLLQPRNAHAHLRAPWCSGEQTLHCASARLSPAQTMGMAWGAAPCPGMAREQDL